ncbi:PDZ domain-containing protein [Roseiconus nitratireducens]|uniref:PDZ domain-containing protein n=1 Tax=Roseiconus nitratireducens TaxID=2605748 RepID=A0A5M6CXP5_9BACT|nr:PDZ domain-containing protein [Roseiconus nitratireducens]KAA5538772.1 PDZ domain-containing protein [Roseiconus nitratireducens]
MKRTLMSLRNKRSRIFRSIAIPVVLTISGGALAGTAQAQVGGLGETNDLGRAVERGVNETLRGTIGGQSPQNAIRGGINESLQSAVETPSQTQFRDQQRYYNQQYGAPTTGQTWQQDTAGRLYYRDGSGQRVYASGQTGTTNQGTIYQGSGSANQGIVWREDANGRLYRVDSRGGRIYRGTTSGSIQSTGQRTAMTQSSSSSGPTLGVAVQPSGQGVTVSKVVSQSVAADAGFQTGDTIMAVNGQAVQSPQSLGSKIRSMNPGDSASFTIMRNGQKQTLTAQLNDPNDRTSVAKPAVDDDSSGTSSDQAMSDLREQVEQLQNEVKQLQQQMNRLSGGTDGEASAQVEAETGSDAASTAIDADASGDAEAKSNE